MGLKEVLYRLIESTPHSDPSLSAEQRYNSIMKALMGDYFDIKDVPTPPHNYSFDQVNEIIKRSGAKKSQRSLILEETDKDNKNTNAEMRKGRFEAIKKYIQRNGFLYRAINDSHIETIKSDRKWEEATKAKIMHTLEEAEWF